MEPRKIAISSNTQLPSNTFTKTYYTFARWTTNADGTGTSYNNNGTINIADDIELYAQWTPTVYSISYNLNGGSLTNQKTSYTIETDTFTLPNPTSSINSFKGWTESNGTTPQTNVQITKGSSGNKSYTANWNSDGTAAVGQTVKYGSYTFVIRTINGTQITMTPNNGISSYRINGSQDAYNNLKTLLDNACIALFNSSVNKSQLTIRSVTFDEKSTSLVVEPSSSSYEYWWYGQCIFTDLSSLTYGSRFNKYGLTGDSDTWGMYLYDEAGKKWSPTKCLFPVVTFNKSILIGTGNGWILQ